MEGRFDVLVTLDRNLSYQQKIAGRAAAAIVVRVPDQTPEAFKGIIPALNKAIPHAVPGEVRLVGL